MSAKSSRSSDFGDRYTCRYLKYKCNSGIHVSNYNYVNYTNVFDLYLSHAVNPDGTFVRELSFNLR